MFYSHQLLARKAPLGQIWMAATMHSKMNRKNVNRLNIIQICEEILNPAVPMALRLSGILMGGVVIIYERKVKLLYDDVTRLLVEINQAWKIKATPDPTLPSKGKSRAKYEAVTLPENEGEDFGEIEQSLHYSDPSTTMFFKQTDYFSMRLDNLDEPYINQGPQGDLPQDYHQTDVDNITLLERFDSNQANTSMYNRFDRFDIEGDDGTELNFTAQENTTVPSTLIPSPPPQEKSNEPDEFLEQHLEDQVNQQSYDGKKVDQDPIMRGPKRRRARKPTPLALDYEQTIIPGPIYQSWLQSSSEIISRRGRKRKHFDVMSTMKTSKLMELPPLVLIDKLFSNSNGEVHFPAPLLELWMRSIQPSHDLPSGRISAPQPPEASSSSPTGRLHDQDPLGYLFEDLHSGVVSQPFEVSIEKLRANLNNNSVPPEILMEVLRTNSTNVEVPLPEDNGFSSDKNNLMATPRSSDVGDEVRSLPSSGSGHAFLSHNSEVNSGRSSKKRPCSSSRHSGSGLEPVAEENPWQYPSFKLARLSENVLAPETELLVETGPTPTQRHPNTNQAIDPITHSIRMQLKSHFDTPGSSQIESLNQLAMGLNKKRAACLFYQTCVLATWDFIRVEQKVPYGEILISRGPKM